MLQPENLILDANGVLKVSDFGLSAFAPQVRVMPFDFFNWTFMETLKYINLFVSTHNDCCEHYSFECRKMVCFTQLVELQTMLLLR